MNKKRIIIILCILIAIITIAVFIFSNYSKSKNNGVDNNNYIEHTITYNNMIDIVSVNALLSEAEKKTYIINKQKAFTINVEVFDFVEKDNVLFIEDSVVEKADAYGYIDEINDDGMCIVIVFVNLETIQSSLLIPIEKSYKISFDSITYAIFNNQLIKYECDIVRIDKKYTTIDEKQYLLVEIIINNRLDNLLLLNSPVVVFFEVGRLNNVLVIPEMFLEDIFYSENVLLGIVYKKFGDDLIEVTVRLGVFNDGNYQIIKGLEDNDIVVLV